MIKRVLLVDDDSDDRDILVKILADSFSSIKVEQVQSTPDALKSLVERPRPDLIFLDLGLPGADGIECLTKLKGNKSTKNIPVVLYSSSQNEMEKKLSLRIGALAFISKTSDMQILSDSVSDIIHQLNKL
jgi:CheY-like chemotaxis protein